MRNLQWIIATALLMTACDSGDPTDAGVPDMGPPPIELNWVALPAGAFMMGDDASDRDYERPAHQVEVPAFELTRAEITVGQYLRCVEAGACPAPDDRARDYRDCTWSQMDRSQAEHYPVNCVGPDDARAFAAWAGGRLPTEAEWEYAARSGGRDQPYPWGHEPPTCERAVMDEPDEDPEAIFPAGCGRETPWPVCSKPLGHTEQGLCDMAGNVMEWIEDDFCDYESTPLDGSAARCRNSKHWIARGGAWFFLTELLRASARANVSIDAELDHRAYVSMGIRVARSMRR